LVPHLLISLMVRMVSTIVCHLQEALLLSNSIGTQTLTSQ
jgi:hypothetical protein